MKAERDNRRILVSDLPDEIESLEIKINYTGDGNVGKAIPLDHIIIPRIVEALNTPNDSKQLSFDETNNIEQRIASITGEQSKDVLFRLVSALHEEDTDKCYKILRDWELEELDI